MTKPTRRVALWNLEGVAAIILEPSGIIYSNQTCGHACLRPEAEGVLVPFNDDPPLDAPQQSLCSRLRRILKNVQQLDADLAAQIDVELAAHPDTRTATVDREHLHDSYESWLHVDLDPGPEALLQRFGRVKAILTWPNSD